MKDKILSVIRLKSGNITYKNLLKKFNIDSTLLLNLLRELKLDGKILQIGNKYMIFPSDLKIGTILISSSGNKYIYYNDERISISSNFLSDVIMSDVVSFKILDNGKAEIVSIIDRPLSKITCKVMYVDGKKKIIPYREGINITLPKDILDELDPNDLILVELTSSEVDNYCDAKFIKKLPKAIDPDEVTVMNYGFETGYSDEYLEEVKRIPTSVSDEEIIGRCDLRNKKIFTIDGINTKDMDDAIYAERINEDIIRTYVNISDVSHYVKISSKIFERACHNTTSVYTNNSVFHMLHYLISNGICSLNPNEDRLSVSIIMDINRDGEIVDFNIVKSVINSKKKMTYEDVDEIFVNNNIPVGYDDFISELAICKEAADRLEKRYSKYGKLDFANVETEKEYNSDGTISEIKNITYSPARKIIEYFMIAANETVASWLYNMGIPAIYRILEQPDIGKINEIIDKLNESGLNIRHVTNVDTPKNIQRMLDRIKNSDKYPLISQMLVMGMKRARYSVHNLGHYALGLEAYLHFTSPIRRLADLIVHMIVDIVLSDYDKLLEYDLDELEKVLEEHAVMASKMERCADMAQLDCERRAVIEHMEKYVGCEYEAIVCDIDKKIKVKLNGIDTYIDYRDFDNNFIFDKKRKLFYDTNSGQYVCFGTKIKVLLTDANSANRTYRVKVLNTIFDKENTKGKTKVKKR